VSSAGTSTTDGAAATSVAVRDLAARLQAELLGDESVVCTRVRPVESAGPGDLTFARSPRPARVWASGDGGALLVSAEIDDDTFAEGLTPGRAVLRVPDADVALIRVLELFAPEPARAEPGVHPSAVIDPSAQVDPAASIGPFVVVGRNSTIGAGAELAERVSIGDNVALAVGVRCRPGVVVHDGCTIGAHTTLHSNVVIGADGFGYRPSPDGQGLIKVPHLGAVTIGAHAEIGAGTCIDRGKLGDTTVGDGTKIDNLVQIGHNCRIGRGCIVCGQVAMGGSVTLGDAVQIGGGANVADNITLGEGSKLAGGCGLMHDIPDGETWVGFPAASVPGGFANLAALRNAADTRRTVKKIAKKLELDD
jgi:UDP-3-O-[3-hydroxymyristoyl] glucosamine N-acyltransferase